MLPLLRILKWASIGVAITAIGAVVSMFILSNSELVEQHYGTHSDAVAAGVIERGWAPRWLPMSARDIRVRYKVDSSARIVAFAFDPIERTALTKRCAPHETSMRRAPHKPLTRNASWWPADIATDIAGTKYLYFRCKERAGLAHLAVRPDMAQAYYWAS